MDKLEQDAYDFMNNVPKAKMPPIGLRPKFAVKQDRIMEILAAMNRYIQSGLPIPIKWVEEYNELIGDLNE